jgi:hypothetical protein
VQVNWRTKTIRWRPTTLNANVVDPIMHVDAGTVIGPIFARTTVAFDGTGTAATVALGYGSNVDEFMDEGELEEESVSAATSFIRCAGAADGTYDTKGTFLFTAADTIDVNFTADTNADSTTGEVTFIIHYARVWPN